MEQIELQRAIEAILFAAGEPVEIAQLSHVLEADEKGIISATDALANDLAYNRRGVRIVRLEKSSFSGSDDRTHGWIYDNAGQMEGYLYVGNRQKPTTAGRRERSFTATYTYVIRAYTKGNFVVESTYVTETASNTVAVSERSKITFH